MLLPEKSQAQIEQGQFETSGSIGALSGIQIVRGAGQALGGGSDRVPEYDSYGSANFIITGKYFFGSRCAVGLSLSLQSINGSSNNDYTLAVSRPSYSYDRTYFTICPEMTFVYVNRRWFRFYALFGAGIATVTTKISYELGYTGYDNKTSGIDFNAQITPLGFGFGGQLKGNIEIGLGYKGLLNAGISYTFGKSHNKNRARE